MRFFFHLYSIWPYIFSIKYRYLHISFQWSWRGHLNKHLCVIPIPTWNEKDQVVCLYCNSAIANKWFSLGILSLLNFIFFKNKFLEGLPEFLKYLYLSTFSKKKKNSRKRGIVSLYHICHSWYMSDTDHAYRDLYHTSFSHRNYLTLMELQVPSLPFLVLHVQPVIRCFKIKKQIVGCCNNKFFALFNDLPEHLIGFLTMLLRPVLLIAQHFLRVR